MASDVLTLKIRLTPDDETMQVILVLLNMWQDCHPDQMVALMPAKDTHQYEIISIRETEGEHKDI